MIWERELARRVAYVCMHSEYPAMKTSSTGLLPAMSSPATSAARDVSMLSRMPGWMWGSIADGRPMLPVLSRTTASAYITAQESTRRASANLPAPARSSTSDRDSSASAFCGESPLPQFSIALRNSSDSPAKDERARPASNAEVPSWPESSARSPASISAEPGHDLPLDLASFEYPSAISIRRLADSMSPLDARSRISAAAERTSSAEGFGMLSFSKRALSARTMAECASPR